MNYLNQMLGATNLRQIVSLHSSAHVAEAPLSERRKVEIAILVAKLEFKRVEMSNRIAALELGSGRGRGGRGPNAERGRRGRGRRGGRPTVTVADIQPVGGRVVHNLKRTAIIETREQLRLRVLAVGSASESVEVHALQRRTRRSRR